MNGVLLLDPWEVQEAISQREAAGKDRYDEVWEGLRVMPPMPNDEHQDIQGGIFAAVYDTVQVAGLGLARPGVNVSDRHVDWRKNYRSPDVVAYLDGNPAVNHGSHWVGGPDLAVEIISPGEDPLAKFDFYAAVHTREVLIVHRDPWYLELFGLVGGKLVSAGRSDLADPQTLPSGTIPLTFRLVPGTDRPRIEVTHPPTGRTWSA